LRGAAGTRAIPQNAFGAEDNRLCFPEISMRGGTG
jgi:hypothetical protein